MASIKVKTMRGYVPINEIGTTDSIKGITKDGYLDYIKVAKVVKYDNKTTYKIGNRNNNLFGWYNVNDKVEVVFPSYKCLVSVFDVAQRYVNVPVAINIGYSGKNDVCEHSLAQIKQDVLNKDIRTIYYDESSVCSLMFLREWEKQYGSLVADDNYTAVLLQNVVANTHLSSYVVRGNKFEVKTIDESDMFVTNCSPVFDVEVSLAFEDSDGNIIRHLCSYEGQCFIR